MTRKILITGAGSGLGEGTAVGLARKGHQVIATAQTWPQVTALRAKAEKLELASLRVEKLDVLDPYDVKQATQWDFDILLNNAGIGEGGPIAEIPLDLVRKNFETNVFAPLALTQQVVKKWIASKTRGKIVFTSSMGGLFSPPGFAAYAATKHAIEAIAEAMQSTVVSQLRSREAELVQRILAPLLENAVRHAASRVTVRVRREDDAVVFSVQDDGAGVPADEVTPSNG